MILHEHRTAWLMRDLVDAVITLVRRGDMDTLTGARRLYCAGVPLHVALRTIARASG